MRTVLESFDKHVNGSSDPAEQRAKVIDACRAFVHVFRATHFVTAIELGAAEYIVEFPSGGDEYQDADFAEQNPVASLVAVTTGVGASRNQLQESAAPV